MKFLMFLILALIGVSCQSNNTKLTKPCGAYQQIDDDNLKKMDEDGNLQKSIELVKKTICEKLNTQTCEFKTEHIEQQIVAGINYKITMRVNYTNEQGKKRETFYVATVWRKLNNTLVLTHLIERTTVSEK